MPGGQDPNLKVLPKRDSSQSQWPRTPGATTLTSAGRWSIHVKYTYIYLYILIQHISVELSSRVVTVQPSPTVAHRRPNKVGKLKPQDVLSGLSSRLACSDGKRRTLWDWNRT